MKNQNKKVLVIISFWPSKQHPYITFLMAGLKDKFPNLQLFAFREGDLESGYQLLGKEQCKPLLKNVLYRFQFSWNPIAYLKPLLTIIAHPALAISLYHNCRKQQYGYHRSIGQLIYNHRLLGKKFDLVYINALQSARHFCLRGLFPNTPIIVSSRGQDFDFEPDGFDQVLKTIDHLHVLGEYLKEKAISRGFSSNKITIIPPAALPVSNAAGRHTKSPKEIKIVSASRLAWTKGYIYALRSVGHVVKSLSNYTIRYHLIGDGPDKEFMKIEARRLNIQDNVIFHGWLSQEEVNKEVSAADIYLLLSIEEGFNNSVLQAQNLGIPCIVSNTGGLPENVEDGVTGFVVPRYNAHAASEAIINLVMDDGLRKKMGEAASKRAKELFNLEKQVAAYAEMFEKVMQDHAHSVRLQ